jgi:exopolysaccharide production protein ExoY
LARRTNKQSSGTAKPIKRTETTRREHVSADDGSPGNARVIYLDDRSDQAGRTPPRTNQDKHQQTISLDIAVAGNAHPSHDGDGHRDGTDLSSIAEVSPVQVLLTPEQSLALEEAVEDDVTETVYVRFGKRLFDVVLVVVTAPLWLPLYAVIALLLLMFEGRPIHYRQERVGRAGREFLIIKFRTMRSNADAELMEVLLRDPGLEHEYRTNVKLRTDPRVTGMGAFLRRSSLDELPQLWNVLVGDMSLVGPRPVRRAEWINCYGPLALNVFRLRPGMTGMWQTYRTWLTTYEERIYLDGMYSARCNLATDLRILSATVPSLIRGDGSV